MFLLVLAVVAAVAAVAAGRLPGGMPEPASTVPPVRLPDRPLTGADVDDLRFVQALRGYRMDQVDDALDRLAGEIERLRALLPSTPEPEIQPGIQPEGSHWPDSQAWGPQPGWEHETGLRPER